MKLQVSGDFAHFARTIVGGRLKSIRIFTELNAPIPTKNEKNIRTYHIISSATKLNFG